MIEPKRTLKPAMVPVPLWNRSVCQSLGPKSKAWRSIRQQVIDDVSGTCDYCTQQYENGKNMVCHEIWEYDDHRHTATLTDFALACRDCNFGLHPGAALEVGSKQDATGKGSIAQRGNQAIEHLRRVNGITLDEAHSMLGQALKLHRERSRHKEWQILIPAHMVEKYPVLNVLTL
ncbi:MAG TPA: hypothetical protein VJS64_07115 [Pyrinomonadaceae bacterium]|nr:hypothetical protein [Pyrinomonadaceae bacterium]